jgi:hypothetical protein
MASKRLFRCGSTMKCNVDENQILGQNRRFHMRASLKISGCMLLAA